MNDLPKDGSHPHIRPTARGPAVAPRRAAMVATVLAAVLLLAWPALPALAGAPAAAPPSGTTGDWRVAGRQGIVLVVIVPDEIGVDKAAYDREIDRLCPQDRTCFVNFYGNSSGADPAVPLPDAIASEPTAMFRRSMKNQAELFRWSCRLNPGATPDCF